MTVIETVINGGSSDFKKPCFPWILLEWIFMGKYRSIVAELIAEASTACILD